MSAQASKFKPIRFSTAGLVGKEALASWRDVCGKKLMKVEMEPLESVPFECDASIRALPGLAIASISSTPNKLTRTRTLAADGNDDFLLVMPTRGATTISAHGREVTLGPGDATLIASADANQSIIPVNSAFLTLAIPAMVLSPTLANLDGALAGFIPAATDVLQLLRGYLDALPAELALSDPALRAQVAAHLSDLACLAVGAGRDVQVVAEGRGLQVARLKAIKAEVTRQLGQRDLSVEKIATQFGVSSRYIRRLFERESNTFTEFVLAERLGNVHAALANPRQAQKPIGTIAFEMGFSDLSYFNHMFRRRYNTTPTLVRKTAAEAALEALVQSVEFGALGAEPNNVGQ